VYYTNHKHWRLHQLNQSYIIKIKRYPIYFETRLPFHSS